MPIAYLNGKFLPLENAHISVMDRGFLFGDGVYEVVPVYNGIPFHLEQHIERLNMSLAGIHMQPPLTQDQWKEITTELIQWNNNGNQALYIQITRGANPLRKHHIPDQIPPTVFAFCQELVPMVANAAEGIAAITVTNNRAQPSYIKSISLLPNILMLHKANQTGAKEAIFIHQGFAIEGTTSNVFIVKQGQIITPPKQPNMIAGVTRDLLLTIAEENRLSHREADIPEMDLHNADEIWVTGSTKEIVPVLKLDGMPINHGEVGALWHTINELYQAAKLTST